MPSRDPFANGRVPSRASRVAQRAALLAATEDTTLSDEYDTVLRNLESTDETVRLEAMDYIAVLSPSVIALHSGVIVPKLGRSFSQRERLRALNILHRLEPEELVRHTVVIAALLDDADDKVRANAARVIDRLHCEELVRRISSPDTLVKALSSRSPRDIEAAVELAKSLSRWSLLRMLVPSLLHEESRSRAADSGESHEQLLFEGKLLSEEEMAQLRSEYAREQLSEGKLLSAEEMELLRHFPHSKPSFLSTIQLDRT
jgi:hypothetical protein